MDMQFSFNTKLSVSAGALAAANNLPVIRPRFGLDRDQIFYSRSFRRLAGKTQLLAAGRDEILRTRLTHTLEVSQIARSIGQALGLDLDLIEAIVLGHDLGHTPFGHVGERTLHEFMTPDKNHPLGESCPLCIPPEAVKEEWRRFLGFKHNLQSLVVAMELEKNEGGRGLNLTEYTLYGLKAHTKTVYKSNRMKNHDMLGYYDKFLEGTKVDGADAWSLEALLVAQADEIAQWHHDLEDALLDQLITPAEILEAMQPLLAHRGKPLTMEEQAVLFQPESCGLDRFTYVFTRVVIDTLMHKLAETAAQKIGALGGAVPVPVTPHNIGQNNKKAHVLAPNRKPGDAEAIFSYGDKKVPGSFAEAISTLEDRIGGILKQQSVQDADKKGAECLQELFAGYYGCPEKLPDESVFAFFGACHELEPNADRDKYELERYEAVSKTGMEPLRAEFVGKFRRRSQVRPEEELVLMRTICNHIASMTDADAKRAVKQFRTQ